MDSFPSVLCFTWLCFFEVFSPCFGYDADTPGSCSHFDSCCSLVLFNNNTEHIICYICEANERTQENDDASQDETLCLCLGVTEKQFFQASSQQSF